MLLQFGGSRFGGGGFGNLFYYLDLWGIREVVLPFLLFFVVLLAVFRKVQLFGRDKRYDVVLSLVISLLVVIPHMLGYYPYGKDVVVIVNESIPGVALVIIAVVMLLLMVGLIVGKTVETKGAFQTIIALLAVLTIIGIFISQIWQFSWVSRVPEGVIWLVIALLVFGVISWYLTRGEPTEQHDQRLKNLFDLLFGRGGNEGGAQRPRLGSP